MPLNPHDQYYVAETTPPSIQTLGQKLCGYYKRPADAFGSKGNTVHYSGYHRSRRWILNSPDSSRGDADYSVQLPLDRAGSADDVCAADFTPDEWGSIKNRHMMVEITTKVYNAAKAKDPRLSNWREFAGTLDGHTVVTFNCADGSLKDPFDSSHLDHFHVSAWRGRARNDHTGLFEIITGTPTTTPQGDTLYLALVQNTGAVWLTNGVTCRWVNGDEFAHLVALHNEGTQPLTYGAKIRTVAYASMLGVALGPIPSGDWTVENHEVLEAIAKVQTPAWNDDERAKFAHDVADLIIAAPSTDFTEAERQELYDAAFKAAQAAEQS